MIQQDFADKVTALLKNDDRVIGLAAAGSWITNEIDIFSDLDLVLITKEKVAGQRQQMMDYAQSFGQLLSAFTGEHVGEPRLLICLYDNPLLHVDIKFLTLPEFHERVENPVLLLDKDQQLSGVIDSTTAVWPAPGYQWLEDRFWTWVHYISGKIGRGEYFEALDGLGFIRARVLSPLLQIKNGQQPRALRKVEQTLPRKDLDNLVGTMADYDPSSIMDALKHSVRLYRYLREQLFTADIVLQAATEKRSLEYLQEICAQLPAED
ncbi:nucleotidyltransferase domain-containing protein [Chitinophaga agrisoli]|uniref:Nucleotidyltransferase domain-containing protein n=1 Tax=Chitinophaga agrisoli TaxID=2607653 RepID=A0A5B2VKV9_9BACT|nr:aminoglycoside 6-adenylyltransferase [Chitinophaga agrisoli]KAA2239338.1 nucleotidyltransferase domain-containing protein [Chitinophaga agrisoli]